MKEMYSTPMVEIEIFDCVDVVTQSPSPDPGQPPTTPNR